MLKITKKMFPKVFDFCKILKMREQILLNPRTFFNCFYIIQREYAHRETHDPQL